MFGAARGARAMLRLSARADRQASRGGRGRGSGRGQNGGGKRSQFEGALSLNADKKFEPNSVISLLKNGDEVGLFSVIHPQNNDNGFLLCLANTDRQGHVKIGENGNLDYKGGIGAWARFYLIRREKCYYSDNDSSSAEESDSSDVQNKKKKQRVKVKVNDEGKSEKRKEYEYQFVNFGNYIQKEQIIYIGCVDGKLTAVSEKDIAADIKLQSAVWFDITINEKLDSNSRQKNLENREPKWDDTVSISEDQRIFFQTQGYLVLKNFVPLQLVSNALQVINSALGKPQSWTKNEKGEFRYGCEGHEDIKALYYGSKVWTLAQLLFGVQNIEKLGGGQVALRFPGPRHTSSPAAHDNNLFRNRGDNEKIQNEISNNFKDKDAHQWHIDGMDKYKPAPFSLLVGIPLSPQRLPFSGNLHVFPESVSLIQSWLLDSDGDMEKAIIKKPNLTNAVHVTVEPGDVVIAHPLLAHRIGPNYSSNIRYQIYFRLKTLNHEEKRGEILEDPWFQFKDFFQ